MGLAEGKKVGAVPAKTFPKSGICNPATFWALWGFRRSCWAVFYLKVCLRLAKINQHELSHYLCPMLLPSDSCSEPALGEVLQWECCLTNSLLWGLGGTCGGETCWAWLCSSWSSQPNSLSKVVFGCLIFVSWFSVIAFPLQIQRKRQSSVSVSSDTPWH